MKILFLTPGCFDKGGISRYSRHQIFALREILGASAVRAYSLSPKKDDDFEEEFDVHWTAISQNHTFNKAHFSVAAFQEILKWRPDLIWAAHINISPLAFALARTVNCKAVLNVYGLELWSGLGRVRQWGLDGMDYVISDCHFSAKFVESLRSSRPSGEVVVMWDAVDVKTFTPGTASAEVVSRYGIPDPTSGINILTLGRMTSDAAHKGYDRLLEAFRTVHKECPNTRLVYAGAGDLNVELAKRAHEVGIDEHVFFLGSIREQDLPDVYRSAHIFSLVSDKGIGRGEGVPVTPIEASACALPIIVGNEDGSPEAVIDGVTGHVVPSRQIDKLADVIVSLARDPTMRHHFGEAGRQRAVAEFSVESFINKHNAFLSTIARTEP